MSSDSARTPMPIQRVRCCQEETVQSNSKAAAAAHTPAALATSPALLPPRPCICTVQLLTLQASTPGPPRPPSCPTPLSPHPYLVPLVTPLACHTPLPLQKELKEIDNDKASGVTAEVVGDNLQHLIGSVPGPKDTPYDGGLFRVDIQLDAQYPFAPPKMRFMTRVWHPNVSSANGAICLGGCGRSGGYCSSSSGSRAC